jgi:MFS family permease
MAAVATVLSLRIHRVDRRRVALGFGALTVAAHVVAWLSSSWTVFLATRVAVGIGEGVLLTVGTAVAAASPRPQRTFALVTFAFVAMGGAIYLAMPALLARVGPLAVFQVLAALGAIGLPCLVGMPRLAPIDGAVAAEVWRPFPWILLGIACHYMAINSLWAFSERIGVALTLAPAAIGQAFLAGVLLTMLGPIGADLAQARWGYRVPILAGVAVLTGACVALGGAQFYEMYLLSFVLLNVTAFYLVPIYRALTAVIDPSGRVAAGSIVVQTVGTAIGPLLASLMLLAGGGYANVGLFAGVLVLSSLALVMRTARRGDAEARRA